MNTYPVHAAVAPAAFPLPRAVIALLCLAFPVLGGTVMYYAWKDRHPQAARYANRLSWLLFGPLLLVAVVAGAAAGMRGKARPGRDASRAAPISSAR